MSKNLFVKFNIWIITSKVIAENLETTGSGSGTDIEMKNYYVWTIGKILLLPQKKDEWYPILKKNTKMCILDLYSKYTHKNEYVICCSMLKDLKTTLR